MKTARSVGPTERRQHVGGARFIPVTGAFGTEVVIPAPMSAGRPQPEPEDEPWTLPPDGARDLPAVSGPVQVAEGAEPSPDEIDGGP